MTREDFRQRTIYLNDLIRRVDCKKKERIKYLRILIEVYSNYVYMDKQENLGDILVEKLDLLERSLNNHDCSEKQQVR